MAADEQDPRPADTDNNLLRKILLRLRSLIGAVQAGGSPIIGPITIAPEDIEIGAVEIKDSTTDDRTKVINTDPVGTEFAVVTRSIIPRGTLTDRSGSMLVGGASQQVMPGNPARKYLVFENVSDEDMWINFSAPAMASQPSFLIKPSGSFCMGSPPFISTEALFVVSATNGSQFTAKEA